MTTFRSVFVRSPGRGCGCVCVKEVISSETGTYSWQIFPPLLFFFKWLIRLIGTGRSKADSIDECRADTFCVPFITDLHARFKGQKYCQREREKASWIAQKNPSTGELKKAQGIHVRAEGEGPNRHLTYKQAPWPVVVVTSVETLLFSTVKRTLSDIQSKQCGRTKHTPGQKQKGQAEKATKQVRATGKMLR